MPKTKRVDELEEFYSTEQGLPKIREWCSKGASIKDLAKHIGVSYPTLYKWMDKHPELRNAVYTSRQIADDTVVHSLYQACFDHSVTEKFVEKDGDGNTVKVTAKTRIIPASPVAMQYWLNNRCSDKWSAHQEIGISGGIPIVIRHDLKAKPKMDEPKEDNSE